MRIRRVAAGCRGAVPGAVVKLDGDRGDEVEIGQRSLCRFGALAQGFEEHVGGFRDESVTQAAVGDLAGQAQVARAHRGDVNRYRSGSHEGLQGAAPAVMHGMIPVVSVCWRAGFGNRPTPRRYPLWGDQYSPPGR